jgi:ElaB/YqjD/DUF883 family membrane-anchored ribosome-binding protein
MDITERGAQTRDKLIDDLKLVIQQAEDLLRNTGQQMDQGYQQARARFESTLSSAKHNLSATQEELLSNAQDAIDSADRYVQQNPWQAAGIGALAGLVIGLWLGSRNGE